MSYCVSDESELHSLFELALLSLDFRDQSCDNLKCSYSLGYLLKYLSSDDEVHRDP
jgi:hypothetical protein